MTSPGESGFHTNPNKDFLRSGYDAQLVERWYRARSKPLKYLGLPAWEMLDIIAWEPFLGRFTTIERIESQQHLLFLRANVKDVEHRLYSLYGAFDEILITGQDRYGNMPEWPYDLANLDYFGGFIYSNLSRPKALKKLISNQATYEHSFLLIITQHLRDGDTVGEKSAFLDNQRRNIKSAVIDPASQKLVDDLLDWYNNTTTPDSARQALYMNVFLRDFGELEHFDVYCRRPLVYLGTGNCAMIHFVTDFKFRKVAHKVASEQPLLEVMKFGIQEVRDGAFGKSIAPPRK